MQHFYILLATLSISIVLLIAVSIHCKLIKHRAKQKFLLPFHNTNNEFKQALYLPYKSKRSNKVKDISIKNHAYYFFDDIISIKIFDSNNIKIDEKSYKNYVSIKDLKYVKMY